MVLCYFCCCLLFCSPPGKKTPLGVVGQVMFKGSIANVCSVVLFIVCFACFSRDPLCVFSLQVIVMCPRCVVLFLRFVQGSTCDLLVQAMFKGTIVVPV